MVKKIALFVFFLVSILDIIGILFKIDSLIFIFKPFILLSLLFLYFNSVDTKNKWYVGGLVFSFFGDIFLLGSGDAFFKFGLVSFLIAHLLFITIVVKRIEKVTLLNSVMVLIPFGFILYLIMFLLKDSLDNLLIPVLIYATTITIFGVTSALDFFNTKNKKSLLMLVGAVVFILSDAVLAINKFYYSSLFFKTTIMITYIIAQYLIYRSMVLNEKKAIKI